MTRKAAAFVPKRPHRKSRAGCLTCKRKKVKCDEAQPKCAYCSLRNIDCVYPSEHKNDSPVQVSRDPKSVPNAATYQTPPCEDFNSFSSPEPSPYANALVPAAVSSAGELTGTDRKLLHFYNNVVFNYMSVRNEEVVRSIHRDVLPKLSMNHPYLLFAVLGVTSTFLDSRKPSAESQNLAALYRQKTLTSYNKALQNITGDNYESLLFTAMYMQVLHPPPDASAPEDSLFDWMITWLTLTQGLRVLASLKWSAGIHKLSIFPLLKRELRSLPPPPSLNSEPIYDERPEGIGGRPDAPNPPATYYESASGPQTSSGPNNRRASSSSAFSAEDATPSPGSTTSLPTSPNYTSLPFRPQELMKAPWSKAPIWQLPAPAFLPPPLMSLLYTLVNPPPLPHSAPFDLHPPVLLPALHALSPIFISLYHYKLSADFYTRIITYSTFLTPDFITLIRIREPRALVIMAWWFTMVSMVPHMWWTRDSIPRMLQAVSNVTIRANNKLLMDIVEQAFRVVRMAQRRGQVAAARLLFSEWEGVRWEDGGKEEGPAVEVC